MAMFENHRDVANQVHTQNVAGSVTNNFNIFSNESNNANRVNYVETLDEEIKSFLAFSHMFDRQESIRKPHQTTCQWVFDESEYKQWLGEQCALLWIKGNPGSGKSTLMSHIYESLQQTKPAHGNILYMSFFFSARGHVLEHSATGMLRSLLNQMFVASKEVRPPLRERYAKRKRAFGLHTTIPQWQQQELEDLCRHAISTCSQSLDVVILMDALDEAGEQSARAIARYLHSIYQHVKSRSGRLRLCLSCRHYPVPATLGGSQIVVEYHNHSDVKKFLHDNFDFLSHDEDNKRQIDSLVQKANGNFQWAEIIVPMVEKLWLDGRTWNYILHWLKGVPKELADVYDHIIHNVIDARNRLSSFLLLMAVYIAERPLTVSEVFALIDHGPLAWRTPVARYNRISKVTEDFESLKAQIRTFSGGLVRVMLNHYEMDKARPESCFVEVVHETVNEYLINGGLAALEGLSKSNITFLPSLPTMNEQQNQWARYNAVMHRVCLRYLVDIDPEILARDHFIGNKTENAVVVLNDVQFITHDTDLRFFKYAAAYLLTHGTDGASVEFSDLQEYMDLLQDLRAFWIRVLCERRIKAWDAIAWDAIDLSDLHHSMTLLHLAAAFNLQHIVRNHIELGYSIDARTTQGKTPLHFAVACGHLDMVQLLVRNGANVNLTTSFVSTSYEDWMCRDRISVSEVLCQASKSIRETPKSRAKFRPLGLAVLFGYHDIFRCLLHAGAKMSRNEPICSDPLILSIAFRRLEIFQALMTKKLDIISYWSKGIDLLLLAVYSKSTKIVQTLLDAGITSQEIDTGNKSWVDHEPDSDRRQYMPSNIGSALCGAARYGLIDTVHLLIKYGFNVNTPSRTNQYALAAAVAAKDNAMQVMKALIAAGANVNTHDVDGKTVVHEVIRSSYSRNANEIVQMLIGAGADINAQNGDGLTPLHAAVWVYEYDIAETLIAAGADLNIPTPQGLTALRPAVMRNRIHITKLLLEAGADVNVRDMVEGTALQEAAANGAADMVALLLQYGASINPDCSKDACVLRFAVRTGSMHLIKAAMANGADVKGQKKDEDASLLHIAVRSGNIEMTEWLIAAGADINCYEPIHGSVLATAILCNEVEMIRKLLQAGARADAPASRHCPSPLQAALSQLEFLPDTVSLIETLLRLGADVNVRDDYHEPPLQIAIRADREDLVKLFIKNGADVNFTSRRVPCPYHVAMDEANSRMANLLLDAGARSDIMRW